MSVLDHLPPSSELTDDELARVVSALPRLRMTGYCPWELTPRQGAFLMYSGIEAFYGGAAGGGKSVALLAGALQYVDVPGYNALILRRTLQELKEPEALLDLARTWLAGTDARWNGADYAWTFPSGATLRFGYLRTASDLGRYQSAAYQYVAFDELTAFYEDWYTFLLSRMRRPDKPLRGRAPDGLGINQVPLRLRGASNPGNLGHEWVKDRFVSSESRLAPFFPATLADNPHLDAASYQAAMSLMSDPVTRERMLAGDWDVLVEGTLFQRSWFNERMLDAPPPGARTKARHWDLAGTEVSPAAPDPDWTVGLLMHAYPDGSYVIADVQRFRKSPMQVENTVRQCAREDGRLVRVGMEQEPGQSGKAQIDYYSRGPLRGFAFEGLVSSKAKYLRAGPVATAAERGKMYLVRGEWNRPFLNELCLFTEDYEGHDDQVDGASGAFTLLHRNARPRGRRAKGTIPTVAPRSDAR